MCMYVRVCVWCMCKLCNIRVLIVNNHFYTTGSPTGRAPGALPGSFEAKLHQAMRAIAEYGMSPIRSVCI